MYWIILKNFKIFSYLFNLEKETNLLHLFVSIYV